MYDGLWFSAEAGLPDAFIQNRLQEKTSVGEVRDLTTFAALSHTRAASRSHGREERGPPLHETDHPDGDLRQGDT